MARNRGWAKLPGVPALLAATGLLVVAAFVGTSVAAGAIGESTTTSTTETATTTETTTTDSTTSGTTTPPTTTTPTTTPPTTTPPPPGQEGCTPGFWRTHPEAYPAPYSPTTTLGSVFAGLPSGYASLTFAQALSLGGGGLNALLRHAVAALLNAASPEVDYPLTTAEVIALTNAAIASGDYEALKDMFDEFNNLTAPGFCD
jgi:hypothetical protein